MNGTMLASENKGKKKPKYPTQKLQFKSNPETQIQKIIKNFEVLKFNLERIKGGRPRLKNQLFPSYKAKLATEPTKSHSSEPDPILYKPES